MGFSTQIVNTVTVLASIIAIIGFVYSIIAFFINNRRKCKNNRRKIRYIPINFNCNYLPNLAKKGIEYTKVQESDLPDILKRFDDDVTLIEELSGVYEQLEKYSELKSEIVFYEKLENTTVFISLLAIRILGIIFAC